MCSSSRFVARLPTGGVERKEEAKRWEAPGGPPNNVSRAPTTKCPRGPLPAAPRGTPLGAPRGPLMGAPRSPLIGALNNTLKGESILGVGAPAAAAGPPREKLGDELLGKGIQKIKVNKGFIQNDQIYPKSMIYLK